MAKKAAKRAASEAKPKTKKQLTVPVSVFENLSLKGVRLISLNSNLDITDGKIPNRTEIQSTASVGPSPDGKILIDGYVVTETTPSNPGENPSKFLLQVHYQCVYEIAGGQSLEDFAPRGQELALVGMHAMWPYIREVIQSISTKAGVPPIILPVFLAKSTGEGAGVIAIPKT